MDCPICFNVIKNSAMGSCTHHFCLPCLLKWCEFGGTKCPKCKVLLSEIKLDREFDNIISLIEDQESENISNNLPLIKDKETNTSNVIVIFGKDTLAGITLENNYNWLGLGTKGPGVVISKIKQDNQCYKNGLRKKDIILFINNIPCINHEQTIQIVNHMVRGNCIMKCTLLKKYIVKD